MLILKKYERHGDDSRKRKDHVFEDVMGNGRNYATDLKELASAADNEGLYYYENGDFE